MSEPLPVANELSRIIAAAQSGAVLVTAPPGSGKTTLVPSALLDNLNGLHRNVILVQPRRIATRSVASWIAQLRGVKLGNEVGYQVRFDNCTSSTTRLFVVTTGILLRRFHDNPLLEGVGAVVLDEFHERSLEMDVALGMLVRLRESFREDLQVCVMSATLDADPVAKLLGDCPVVHAEGRRYPVDIRYAQHRDAATLEQQVLGTAQLALQETTGHVLVFLPGVGEIMRCRDAAQSMSQRHDLAILTLYGDLPPEQQDLVLQSSVRRKLIFATNVAETSLTIDGVTAVIDSGLARQIRYAPAVGLPRLELAQISRAAADQRAGRAGRTAPGICWRLWGSSANAARPVAEVPEIHRQDLCEAVLQLCFLGERDIAEFPWISPPSSDAVDAAKQLLRRLDLLNEHDRATERGRLVARMPVHPRLAVLILAGADHGVLEEAAIAAALLSERDPFRSSDRRTNGPHDRAMQLSASDITDRVFALDRLRHSDDSGDPELICHPNAAKPIFRAAEQFVRLAKSKPVNRANNPELALRRALLDAFPDRLIKLRCASSDRGLMVGGKGIRLDSNSRVRHHPLLLGLEINNAAGDARVRLASSVERAWLTGSAIRVADEVFYHPTRQQVEARRRTYWLDLLLEEAPTEISDMGAAAELLAKHAKLSLNRMLPDDDAPAMQFLARVRWLATTMPELELPSLNNDDLAELLPAICAGLRAFDQLRQANWLDHFQQNVGYQRLTEIDRLAPRSIEVPSGNRISLKYVNGQTPVLAVRIQELFGWTETPRIAGGRVALLLHLLGPNYRPQQVTSDLASFWQNTYPQIKKELKRRYPKHAWPDDPKTASPTRSGLKPQ